MSSTTTTTERRYYSREWFDRPPFQRDEPGFGKLFDDPFFRRGSTLDDARPEVPQRMKEETSKFEIVLDMSEYAPDQIYIKVVDRDLSIEANHPEKRDEHGFISRTVKRRFVLPRDVDIRSIVSEFNKGILTIRAPKQIADQPKERIIPVRFVSNSNLSNGK